MKIIKKRTKALIRKTGAIFSRAMREEAIQAALIEHWRMRGMPGTILAAIPNGELRHISVAKKLKAQGVLPGMPDLIAVARSRTHFIEVKAFEGRLSKDQDGIHADLRAQNQPIYVINSLDDGLHLLEEIGILRPSAIERFASLPGGTHEIRTD